MYKFPNYYLVVFDPLFQYGFQLGLGSDNYHDHSFSFFFSKINIILIFLPFCYLLRFSITFPKYFSWIKLNQLLLILTSNDMSYELVVLFVLWKQSFMEQLCLFVLLILLSPGNSKLNDRAFWYTRNFFCWAFSMTFYQIVFITIRSYY